MSALVCDICGGKLVGKAGGVFVCDSCGMEYTKEWAREKVQEIKGAVSIEGKVDVSGSTVKVDDSESVEKFIELSKQAYISKNGEKAYDFANKALEIDPKSVQAWIAKMMSIEFYSTENDLRLIEAFEAGKSSIEFCEDNEKPYIEDTVYSYLLKRAANLIEQAKNGLREKTEIKNTYDKYSRIDSNNAGEIVAKIDRDTVEKYDRIAEEGIKLANAVSEKCLKSKNIDALNERIKLLKACDSQYILESDALKDRLWIYYDLTIVWDKMKDIQGDAPKAEKALDKRIDDAKNSIIQIENNQKEERFNEYWKEHDQEKEQLEAEKNSINNQIEQINTIRTNAVNEIRKALVNASVEDEISSVNAEKAKLQNELDSLGLFKGKEKKALQEQIAQLTSRIKSIEKRMDDEEVEVNQKANKEFHSYDAQIQPLEQRIKEIDEELTKPR